MNLIDILEKLYVTQNYTELFQELKNSTDEKSLYFLGKLFFQQCDFKKAEYYFKDANLLFDAARCNFFLKNLKEARKQLSNLKDTSIASDWLLFLVNLIENKTNKFPTFFQVRNFLEVDLSILFESNNIEYAEKIINSYDYFTQANAEANKFFARVLYNYHYIGLSQMFLDKSLDVYYKDPETHFLKAQCYIKEGEREKAKQYLNFCLEFASDYFPAKKLLKEIE